MDLSIETLVRYEDPTKQKTIGSVLFSEHQCFRVTFCIWGLIKMERVMACGIVIDNGFHSWRPNQWTATSHHLGWMTRQQRSATIEQLRRIGINGTRLRNQLCISQTRRRHVCWSTYGESLSLEDINIARMLKIILLIWSNWTLFFPTAQNLNDYLWSLVFLISTIWTGSKAHIERCNEFDMKSFSRPSRRLHVAALDEKIPGSL